MAKEKGIINDGYIDSEDIKINVTNVPKETKEAMFAKTELGFVNTLENSVKTSNINNQDDITLEDVAVIEKTTVDEENDLNQIVVVFATARSNLSMGSDANQLTDDLICSDAQDKNVIRNEENLGDGDENLDSICYKFKGPAFRSLSEQKLKKSWRRRSLGEELKFFCKLNESTPELDRSQYSLVSCTELTPGAVQLWLGLPEEVKYDPSLESFRKLYEKECGKDNTDPDTTKSLPKSRLPLVNSAPHLNNNLHRDDVAFINGKDRVDVQDVGKTPIPESGHSQKKESKLARAGHLVKMTLLIATWIFFTIVFLMYNEKEEIVRNTSVAPNEIKQLEIHKGNTKLSVLLKLAGPFLSENSEAKLKSSANRNKFQVWLEMTPVDGKLARYQKATDPWTIILEDDKVLDFSVGEKRTKTLRIEGSATSNTRILFKTNTNVTVPFTIEYTLNPLDTKTGVIYACIILCGLYVLIISEIINRTMAAVLMSTVSVAVLALCGERPSLSTLLTWLDSETLLLLFSMMILVAIMAETGMFDFLAVFTFEVTKGSLWPLISLLCAITAVLSTFLDNVTTVLLMTPVTIRLCEVMELDPIPILMSMVLFSNIGGTATPVGDPPNVIIVSNKAVVQAGVNFTNFTLHMTLGILLVAVQTYLQLRFIFRDTSKMRIGVPRDIRDLRQQIIVWRRATDSLPNLSKDHLVVRERLERKVRKLQSRLEILEKESHKRACPKDTFDDTLKELKGKLPFVMLFQQYKIRDKMLLIKSSVSIGFVVIMFFLHAVPELNRVSLGWTALLGAILLLLLWDRAELEPALHKVEWGTLLFFAALFVLMEALSELGLIAFIGGLTESLIMQVNEKARLAVALLLLLWVSGVSSAFVDNIPLTTMMVRVVTSLGSNPTLNLPMMPLIWALSFGACLGGNGTLIGASANVVCAGVAEQHGYKFSFMQFFKIGFPMMIGHLIVASFYLLICHCAFTWH